MNTIRILAVVGLLFSTLCTGCSSSPKTPQRVAYNVTDNVLSAADAAIASWADYVVIQKRQIASLPLEQVAPARAKLSEQEFKVRVAFDRYQKAATAAVNLGASASSIESSADYSKQISEAASALITVINQFIK